MKIYSIEDAEYLKEYYSGKIIGKHLDLTSSATIEKIEIRPFGKSDKYSVVVLGNDKRGLIPNRSIEAIASNLHLSPPDAVLKMRGQTKNN